MIFQIKKICKTKGKILFHDNYTSVMALEAIPQQYFKCEYYNNKCEYKSPCRNKRT